MTCKDAGDRGELRGRFEGTRKKMCGIAGFVNFHGHRREEAGDRLRRMSDCLVHRGPDEEGFYVDDYAALGHRRLSIIDLSNGQQPMGVLGGQIQIVFNGEIYNFQELRAELKGKGYKFRTRSDTEAILWSYVEWGDKCLQKLSGMFAFVIWDARERRLLLARDRVGKKPLYYYHRKQTLAFASELKALRAGGLCPDRVDLEALDCYLSFGYVPSPRSIYRGVRKLQAAQYCTISENGGETKSYWDLSFSRQGNWEKGEAVDQLDALLDSAVESRLVSEVPLGVFLSGGIDSTLVVSSMARLMSSPVVTNSIGFDDKNIDELPLAGLVAEHFSTDHHKHVINPQVEEILEKIAWHFDEPFADSSAVPTWYVCQMARQNVTVALSGDGGDEGFAGYSFRYIPHALESTIRRAVPLPLRRLLFGTLGSVWPGTSRIPKPLRLKTIFENLSAGDAEAFFRDLVWLRPDDRVRLYSPEFMDSLHGFTPMEEVQPWYAGSDARDPLGRSQDADIHFYMTDDVLVKVDRMSMAHSLEVRSPFLDHRLLEFAAQLPTGLKQNFRQGKLLLRELSRRRLPGSLVGARKRGFSIPAARWLRNELRFTAEEVIFDSNRELNRFLRVETVRQLWNEHQKSHKDHSVLLWGLMMLGLWEKHFG